MDSAISVASLIGWHLIILVCGVVVGFALRTILKEE